MNQAEIMKKMNKIIWHKFKKYFKNKSNKIKLLYDIMPFKFHDIILENISINILIQNPKRLNIISNLAFVYCLKKAKRI